MLACCRFTLIDCFDERNLRQQREIFLGARTSAAGGVGDYERQLARRKTTTTATAADAQAAGPEAARDDGCFSNQARTGADSG